MSLADRVLFHQAHPAKLATDIGSTIVAIPLLWGGDLTLGLLVALGAPVIGSAIVLASADLRPIAEGRIGPYLSRYMTPPVQALRLAMGLLVLWAAWVQAATLMVAAIVVIVIAWANGLVWRRGPGR